MTVNMCITYSTSINFLDNFRSRCVYCSIVCIDIIGFAYLPLPHKNKRYTIFLFVTTICYKVHTTSFYSNITLLNIPYTIPL